jgi:peptidoglycan LD-endopeptidase LytH
MCLSTLNGCQPKATFPTPTLSVTEAKLTNSPTPTLTPFFSRTPSKTNSPTSTHTPVRSPTSSVNPWQYVFPVQPNDRHVSYLEGTAAHGYPAIDIFAPAGWKYVAVTSGTVEFISPRDVWDKAADDPNARGGISVAIIGNDGIRYYGSHLSGIAEGIRSGVKVTAGQVLGYIGESGNARGRGTHLHFGISHPTYPEDWKTRRGEINPFPYLNAWVAGLNVTPLYSTTTPTRTP